MHLSVIKDATQLPREVPRKNRPFQTKPKSSPTPFVSQFYVPLWSVTDYWDTNWVVQQIKFSPDPDSQNFWVLATSPLQPLEIGDILLTTLLEISNLQPFLLELYLLFLYKYSLKTKYLGMRSSTEYIIPWDIFQFQEKM